MTPLTRDLSDFLDASPCNFLAVRNLAERLEGEGFVCLDFRNRDALEAGGKYYYTVNGSALIAFIVGDGEASEGFKIISAHSDSPGFRIKPHAEMMCPGRILKLNTEVYGGPILYTWFDRPLSISGRVILRNDADPLRPEIITMKIDRPLLTIPHLAIHFNRQVNEGNPLSKQKDMLPVLAKLNADMEADNFLLKLIANECGCDISDILDFDLTLYDTTKACTFGADNEFISSGRLDDLSMVHAGLTALLALTQPEAVHEYWLYSTTRKPARAQSRVRHRQYSTWYCAVWSKQRAATKFRISRRWQTLLWCRPTMHTPCIPTTWRSRTPPIIRLWATDP